MKKILWSIWTLVALNLLMYGAHLLPGKDNNLISKVDDDYLNYLKEEQLKDQKLFEKNRKPASSGQWGAVYNIYTMHKNDKKLFLREKFIFATGETVMVASVWNPNSDRVDSACVHDPLISGGVNHTSNNVWHNYIIRDEKIQAFLMTSMTMLTRVHLYHNEKCVVHEATVVPQFNYEGLSSW